MKQVEAETLRENRKRALKLGFIMILILQVIVIAVLKFVPGETERISALAIPSLLS
jgi:hypothetical protein